MEAVVEPQTEEEGGSSQTVRLEKKGGNPEKGNQVARIARLDLKAAASSASSGEGNPEVTSSRVENPEVMATSCNIMTSQHH